LSEIVEIANANNNKSELEEAKILKSITTFGETDVKEIMKARVDVFAVNISTPTEQLIELIKEQGYSRIPIFKENYDGVEGVLYIKDLLSHLNDKLFHWQDLIRQAFFVPENKKINDLLQEFKKKKIHLAIVVDEYGGTSGIVTLEDILEEIVGEISDEFDIKEDSLSYKKIDEKTWVFDAKTSINDLCKIINIDAYYFDKIKGESDSIAGLILELKGEFPKINDIIKYNNIEFEVLMMDNRRIKRIKLKML